MYDPKEFGKRLKQLREAAGKTQEQLADLLHISVTHEGKLEKGGRTPSVDLLLQISDYFSVSVDYLLKGQAQPVDGMKKSVREVIRELQRLEKLLP